MHLQSGWGALEAGLSVIHVAARWGIIPLMSSLVPEKLECALSHYISARPNTDIVSVSRYASSQDIDITYNCDQPSSSTELVKAQ